MDIQITGKAIELGNALQTHVKESLSAGVGKYFERSAEGTVVFDKDGAEIDAEITVHLASGVFLSARDRAHDAYGAFDGALTKLEKRVRRYKRRLKDHHSAARNPLPAETASAYVIKSSAELADEDMGEETGEESGDAPLIIAEQTTILRSMPVSDAVLQLDVSDAKVLVFRNAKHGHLSVVYRRDDGNIGWIDGERVGA